jgi:predicted nucleic acid-binding protein
MHTGGQRYFVDANIVLYAAGESHEYKEPCLSIMEALASRRLRGITSMEVVLEVAHHYVHHRRLDVVQFVLDRLAMSVEQILPIEFEDAQLMLALVRQQPDFPARDALHAAVMQRAGLTHILTADRHFVGVPDLTVLDPHAAAAMLQG